MELYRREIRFLNRFGRGRGHILDPADPRLPASGLVANGLTRETDCRSTKLLERVGAPGWLANSSGITKFHGANAKISADIAQVLRHINVICAFEG